MNISSLWIGESLSMSHQIALSSFIYYGHRFNLYVYDMDLEVPKGVTKIDANTILSNSTIFKSDNSYAAFADLFRYRMILKTGEVWVDADTICLTENFLNNMEYAFIKEAESYYSNGILKMPKDSELAKTMYLDAINIVKTKDILDMEWGTLGPKLLTKNVTNLGLQSYAIDALLVNGFDLYSESAYDIFYNPEFLDVAVERFSNAISATFLNSYLSRRGIDKNDIIKNTGMDFLYKKFMQ